MVNDAIVKSELYVWNRFADLLETLRCGVAVGPCVGAEIAVTEHAMLGALAAVEAGASFPHFVPPLWLVPYAEEATPIISVHEGVYATLAYGPVRKENSTEVARHFDRDPLDLSVNLGLGMAHAYAAVKTNQIIDFGAGLVVTIRPMTMPSSIPPSAAPPPTSLAALWETSSSAGSKWAGI